MKKKRSIIAIAAACAMAATIGIGGTYAYLTSSDTTTNTFTVGRVEGDTLEPNYPGNGSDEATDLTANEIVSKDPQVRNTGKNRAIVFMRVDIPMKKLIVADPATGERKAAANTELFRYTDKSDIDLVTANDVNGKWIPIHDDYKTKDRKTISSETADDVGYHSYYFGYETVLEPGQTTNELFKRVQLANIIENQSDGDQLDDSKVDIIINSYLIQADNITGITSSDNSNSTYTKTMDADTLQKVWGVYAKQSGDETLNDADTSNRETLNNTTLNLTITIADRHLELNSNDKSDAETKAETKIAYTGSGAIPEVKYSSSDPQVATVDAVTGAIKAVAPGRVVITASAVNPDTGKTVKASSTVQVVDLDANAVLSLKLNVSDTVLELTHNTGDSNTANASVIANYTGKNALGEFTWESSNQDVVSLSASSGSAVTLTGLKAGTSVITVSAVNPDTGVTVLKSVTVTVK